MATSSAGAGRAPQRPLPSDRSDTNTLGRGQGRDFQFNAPEGQQSWLREAYRQAVSADSWHLGDKVDDKVRDAILAGVGGAQPPMYRGPDRQYYFQNARTIEDATTRGHRAQHFAGKTMDQVTAAKMPGEDEYVTLREALSARAVAAAKRSVKPAANDDVSPDNATPEAAVQALFGMVPGIERTNIIPDPRGPDGKFTSDVSQWTAPQIVYGAAKAFVTPAVVANGGKVSDGDALNLALTIAGTGAPVARATLPANSAGMWYNAIPAPSWSRVDEVVDIFRNPTKAEFRKASANGAARAAKDHSTGDIYIWDGERALHNDVIQKLPQNGMVDSAGTLWSYDDYVRLKNHK